MTQVFVPELTAAERRVVDLAAEGLTNREISVRLYVTVKAVEWHLRHVFQKLGISSRHDLPGAPGPCTHCGRGGGGGR